MWARFIRFFWKAATGRPEIIGARRFGRRFFSLYADRTGDVSRLVLFVNLRIRTGWQRGGALAADSASSPPRDTASSLTFFASGVIFANGQIATRSRRIGLGLDLDQDRAGGISFITDVCNPRGV